MFVENNATLSFTLLFDSLDFVAPPILRFVLRSPEGEVGELPVLVPITSFNFYCLQPTTSVECKSLFQRQQMKELTLRCASDGSRDFFSIFC